MKCVIRAEGKTKRKWRAPSIPTKTMPLILEYLVPPAMFIHTNICRYKSISMPVPCILCRHGSAGKNVSLLGLNKTMHNLLTRSCFFFLVSLPLAIRFCILNLRHHRTRCSIYGCIRTACMWVFYLCRGVFGCVSSTKKNCFWKCWCEEQFLQLWVIVVMLS